MDSLATSMEPDDAEAARDERDARRRLPRWAWIGFFAIAFLVVLFLLGGGWYVSGEIASDALAVEDDTDDYRFEVIAVGADEVTFAYDDHEDLLSDEVLGVAWPGGYGLVEERFGSGEGEVTRAYVHLHGAPLAAGTLVDLQGYAAPEDPALIGIDVQTVEYQSPFGLFDAWYVPGTQDTWAIFVHGRGAMPHEGLRLLPAVVDEGYPALLITYRNDEGQPATDDRLARFGDTEWEEVEAAVRFATERGADDVILIGYSMGGGMAVSFLLESDLAGEVRAVILDAPALDLEAMVDARAEDTSLPVIGLPLPGPVVEVGKWLTSIRYDVDWVDIDYMERAAELTDPILLFHGTEDDSVPVAVSDEFAELRPDLVTYERFEGAGHVRAWNVDADRYEQAVEAFLSVHG